MMPSTISLGIVSLVFVDKLNLHALLQAAKSLSDEDEELQEEIRVFVVNE